MRMIELKGGAFIPERDVLEIPPNGKLSVVIRRYEREERRMVSAAYPDRDSLLHALGWKTAGPSKAPQAGKVKADHVKSWAVIDGSGEVDNVFESREKAVAKAAEYDERYSTSGPHIVQALIPAEMVEDDND